MIEGVLGVQKEAVLASKRSVVTVEEIVDELPERQSRTQSYCRTGPSATSSRCRAAPSRPMRRATTRATTTSTRNGMQSPRERDSFQAWMKENVLAKGPEAFAKYARKHRIAAE